jgi:hypothetical protein
MAIQFYCPQGHLLQGDEAHMGMQTQCPYCGVMFIIPVIDPQSLQAAYVQQQGMPYIPAPQQGTYLPPELNEIFDPTATQPGLREFLDQVAAGEVAPEPQPTRSSGGVDIAPPPVGSGEPGSESFLHIPCPNGHELETPYDMLGQQALCPHCGVQFCLRHEDSREYHEKLERIEEDRAKFWFNWAVAAAVLIGGGLFVLLLMAFSK